MNPLRSVIGLLSLVLAFGCGHTGGAHSVESEGAQATPAVTPAQASQRYTCAMHPQVVVDHPGTCPICGMDLVPESQGTSANEAQSGVPEGPPLPPVDPGCTGVDCRLQQAQALVLAAAQSADAMLVTAALPALPDDRLPALLADPRGLVRLYAAAEVGHRHLVALRTPLRVAAHDARDDATGQARLAALAAAGDIGDEEIADLLRAWLRDERPLVRTLAVASADHLPALRAVVAQMAEHDPDRGVRDQAELTLALLRDAAARAHVLGRRDQRSFRVRMMLDADATRPELLRLLARPPRGDSERDFILRSSAASALLSQGDEHGREALHQMIASAHSGHLLPLLQFLAPFASAADLEVIVPFLASTDDLVRVQAAAIYWKVGR